jgi:hypothetical protein
MRILGYSCNSPLFRLLVAGLLLAACTPAYAGLFSNEKHDPVPQWGLDAAKTPTPANVKDAPSVVLFDEYVEIGSTILCESEELLEPYLQETVWGIQSGIPVVFQALEVDLPAGRVHTRGMAQILARQAGRGGAQPLALGD